MSQEQRRRSKGDRRVENKAIEKAKNDRLELAKLYNVPRVDRE